MNSRTVIDDPVLLDFRDEIGDTGPVAISGNRTCGDLGGAIQSNARSIKAPTGIVAYQPDEMTVTVRAGTTVAELHEALAARGQLTALPERNGTVGGALAAGLNGTRTLGRGRVRESLLQVRYVSSNAKIVTGGGPTVKNVTGFDLPRLMVGSLGTLGFIGEVILRTNPAPERRELWRANGINPTVVSATVLRPRTILFNGETTWVELGGHADTVKADSDALSAVGPFERAEHLPELPQHRWSLTVAEAAQLGAKGSEFGAKGSEFGAEGAEFGAEGAEFDTGRFVALIGVGVVFGEKPQPARAPSPGVTALCEQMKDQFDPTRRLNPGRSVNATTGS